MTAPATSAEQRAQVAALLGDARPARDSLIAQLAEAVRDRVNHDHPAQAEDLYCFNLTSFIGERMGPVLRRLLNAEAEAEALAAELAALRHAATSTAGAAVRSVHQRGHDIHLPLGLMEFLTGEAETAALAAPGALARDGFEVVISSSGSSHAVAQEVRCTECGGITTQAGFDGQGWTLARLDLLADRHRCLPRVTDADTVPDPVHDRPDTL
ncbi:hypothetical protein [Streptomyces sp. NPDC127038]|uniref:hypothetical protein n=1 Tax=Streptomyces sp. NPDC127038 TaxID=3347114 RepID=UPI003664D7A3